MKLRKNLWLSSSILSLFAYGAGSAVNAIDTWQPRSVDDVQEDLVIDENKQVTYTVVEGDTLSVISEAMNIDVRYLADINGISNIDLILPGTVLTSQLNQNNEAVSLSVEAPSGETANVELPVNLSPIGGSESVEVEETVTSVAETTTAPVIETTIAPEVETTAAPVLHKSTASLSAEAPVYKVESVLETTSAPVVETTAAPIAETTSAPVVETTTAPVAETTSAPVVETTAAPVVETTTAPVAETTSAPVVETTAAPVVETTSAPVETTVAQAIYKAENAGLKPHVAEYKERVGAQYGVDSYSLYRPGDPGDHGKGLAVDFMVPVNSQQGDDIANYSVNNMTDNNISYVIWKQKIYGDWTNGQWKQMEDRGGVTANHYDHVHVSFNP